MKPLPIIITFLLGSLLGWFAGSFKTSLDAQVSVLSGPCSDNYPQALNAIADAKARLQAGDKNIMEQLATAESHIRAAQDWSQRFLGQTTDGRR